MKRHIMLFVLLAIVVIYSTSCARGISTYEAANGKAKCGRYIR